MRRRWYYFKRMLQADRLFVAQMIGNIIRMIQYAGRWIVLAVVCVAALYLGRGLCAGAWKDFYFRGKGLFDRDHSERTSFQPVEPCQ